MTRVAVLGLTLAAVASQSRIIWAGAAANARVTPVVG
jgi:hypothetical protein